MAIRPAHKRLIEALGILLLACTRADASEAKPGSLQLEPCRLQSETVGGSAAARCASFEVPENRADPSSKTIRLHVAVVSALRTEAEPDPLFVLTGGPGQAASDFYLTMNPVLGRIRRDRDIVIVDQRGTGRSNRLDCALPNDADLTQADPATLRAHARECVRALPGDARFYTTSVAVQDLEEVRAALGYEKINLYGISYGTRVAQHYLRRHPARVRAVVLDGVVPPQLALGPRIALDAQRALDALFERCAGQLECARAFPDVRAQFAALRARLAEKPMEVSIADPVSARSMQVRFGIAELNAVVRLLSYSDETASTLPLLIHQAHSAQRPEPIAAQFEMIKRSMEAQLAYGMHFSVVCSEDAPGWDREQVSETMLRATYIGADFMTAMKAVCEEWPRGPVDQDFSAPLESEVPVLALSGEHDPVTPPEYAERSLERLPNSKHLVLAGQGHGQLAVGCMPRVVARFIATARLADLGEDCLDTVAAAPFMISSTGPAP